MPTFDLASRFAREPLVHFVALGAAVFALHAAFARPSRDGRIVVSLDFREGLRQEHAARTGRPPTPDEERAMIDRFIDEEVLYREAVALGLDRGDPIVRRRLAQKMTFIAEDGAAAREPSDAELRAFLDAHADRYREPPRVSFRHVFLSRDRRGSSLDADARKALDDLAKGARDAATLGDPFLQGSTFTRRTAAEVEAVFGRAFASALVSAKPGAWVGPIASSYGAHVVEIQGRADGAPAKLDAVRARVRADLIDERRATASREMRARLRARYAVEIEAPRAAVAGAR